MCSQSVRSGRQSAEEEKRTDDLIAICSKLAVNKSWEFGGLHRRPSISHSKRRLDLCRYRIVGIVPNERNKCCEDQYSFVMTARGGSFNVPSLAEGLSPRPDVNA